ncbi:MAG: response regulator [Verrucomicrobia bacterium]|nr:response regulator [Verrucomicrobiota bacterium]
MKPKLKHELRTPLNHILGYAEMLLEETRATEVGEWHRGLERVHALGQTLQRGVDELAPPPTGGPDSSGPPRTPPEWPGLVGEIRGVAEQLAALAPPDLPDAPADLTRIRDAAENFGRLIAALAVPAASGVPSAAGRLELETEEIAAEEESVSGTDVSNTEPGRLLVVDDDEGNRRMLERRLRRLGHDVLCAADGREALALLHRTPRDLVLLDIQMPVLDGEETLRILRADPELQRLSVIVLSASRDLSRVVRCIGLGAEDYLPKPFNPVLLRARIDACLGKKRLQDREAEHRRRIEELLHVILPREVARELQATRQVQPRAVAEVAVLFTDLAGFTSWCSGKSAIAVHRELQGLVEAFEEISARHGLEKIKTIGDSFMAVAGLLSPLPNPAAAAVACGLELARAAATHGEGWRLRVGVHAGPVSAGVIGRQKYQYDVWGDTVNTASRMEQAAPPGSVCVEASTWAQIAAHYEGESRGVVSLKGKGEREIYRVTGLRNAPPGGGTANG